MPTWVSDPKDPSAPCQAHGLSPHHGTWYPSSPGLCPALPTPCLAPPAHGWFLLKT